MNLIQIWTGSRLKIIIAISLCLPLPGVACRLMGHVVVRLMPTGTYAVVFEEPWIFAVRFNKGKMMYFFVLGVTFVKQCTLCPLGGKHRCRRL